MPHRRHSRGVGRKGGWENGKGKGKENESPATHAAPTKQARTIVLHGALAKYKPGQIRRWIEDNQRGVHVQGIRWLTQEYRGAGKLASSLVVYLKERIDLNHGVRIGRRIFRITEYDWNRWGAGRSDTGGIHAAHTTGTGEGLDDLTPALMGVGVSGGKIFSTSSKFFTSERRGVGFFVFYSRSLLGGFQGVDDTFFIFSACFFKGGIWSCT